MAKGHHVSSQSSPPSSSTSNAGSRLESGSYTSHIPLLSSMTPVTNLPTVASYQSTVSRESQSSHRPSPRLHEIQPPSRRLSTHQMLLLTPFGGQLPATALTTPGGPLGMLRVSSKASIPEGVAVSAGFLERSSIGLSVSMKGSRSNRGSLMEVSSSSMGLGIGIGTGALDMSKNLSSTPMSHLPTRSCQPLSAGSGVINSSPLVSAPTSSQALVSRPGDQRDPKRERTQPPRSTTGMPHGPRAADKSANNHEIDGRLQLMPATVAMTRCNSLPVLTLRELEAIQEKDGDLGIQRGGHWAWVSREVTVDEDGNEVYAQSFFLLSSKSLLIRLIGLNLFLKAPFVPAPLLSSPLSDRHSQCSKILLLAVRPLRVRSHTYLLLLPPTIVILLHTLPGGCQRCLLWHLMHLQEG